MLVRSYRGKPEEVRRARQAVREFLDGCPAADDVVLVVSELAGNAVRHSRSRGRGGRFAVCVERMQTYVHIAVIDDGGGSGPAARGDGIHGLDVISALTNQHWGVVDPLDGDGHRSVWAKVHFEAARPAATSPVVSLPVLVDG